MSPHLLERLAERLIAGDDRGVLDLTQRALAHDLRPADILDRGLLGGMAVVGERFRDREIFLPDVLLAARAMHGAMGVLKPLLVGQRTSAKGKVVLGTVSGDLHDIGKNLVGILLEGAGFDVVDLGTDVSADAFVDAAIESGAGVIGMSALLTTTMTGMADVVRLVHESGLGDRVATIVGGAPVTKAFAREIGADGYAPDASSAVETIGRLVRTT
jgi:5-methyltetrahydrofolate--homocysteine methyltransferase